MAHLDFAGDPFFTQADFCWLTKNPGCIPMVRNQGRTDCCYAFVVTTTMYAEQFLKGTDLRLGSVQELLDRLHIYRPPKCVRQGNAELTSRGYPNSFKNAFEYVRDLGIYSDDQYPFVARYQHSRDPIPNPDFKIYIKGFKHISRRDLDLDAYHQLIVNQLRELPVTGSVILTLSFLNWSDRGVYQPTQQERDEMDDAKRKDEDPPYHPHALTLLGYGVESGIPYYLCQNSYGEGWGYRGYVKVERTLVRNVNYPVGTYTSKEKRKSQGGEQDAGQSIPVEDAAVGGYPSEKKRKIEITGQSGTEVEDASAGEYASKKKRKVGSACQNPTDL